MVIVVEHRDRLARVGTEHRHGALSGQVRRIVVVDEGETSDGLVCDMVEVLSSRRARLDGRRGAGHRALRAATATRVDRVEVAG
jgi:putative resolvase